MSTQSLPSLPPYVEFTKPTNKSTVSDRRPVNQAAARSQERQLSLAASGAPIPIIYGRDIGAALIANILYHANYWVIQAIWCEGAIDAIETVYFDNKPVPAGVLVTHYTGTSGQTVNTHLQAAFTAKGITYTDTLAGIAYSVFRVPASVMENSLPNITAVIRGRKVWNPATEQKEWSASPALILADVLTDTTIGCGFEADWASVAAAAAYNAELVEGEPRSAIGVSYRARQSAESVVEALRTYASVWLVPSASGIKFIVDKPAAVTRTLAHANGDIVGIRQIRKTPYYDAPTIVRIEYTNPTAVPWTDSREEAVWDLALPYSKQRIQELALPGYHSASMARRAAIERLNKFNLYDLQVEVEVFDRDLGIEVGDVIALTHPVGFTNKEFRVTSTALSTNGLTLQLEEYSAVVYSNAVAPVDELPDVDLPSPDEPTRVGAVTAVEEVFLMAARTYSSRLRVTWEPSEFPFIGSHEVLVKNGSTIVFRGQAAYGAAEWVSPAVQEGPTYTVEVRVISVTNRSSAPSSTTVTALGKFLPPGPVPAVSIMEKNRVLYLNWLPAIDIDIWRYEIRRGAVGVEWAAAELVDRVDGLTAQIANPTIGVSDYLVKAVDSVGQYSATPARTSFEFLAPASPATLTGAYAVPTITLKWSAAALAKHYEIRVGAVGVEWNAATVVDRIDSLELAITANALGAFDYLVKSIDSLGNYSETPTRATVTVAAPATPSTVSSTYASPSITLKWAAAPTAKHYEVRVGAVGVAWNAATVVDRVDSLELRVLAAALGSLDYLVKTIDVGGYYSAEPTRTTATVTPPATVTGFRGFEVGGEARLSWNANTGTGVKNYEVRYGAVGTTWANATVIDRTDALRLNTKSVPVGEWDFLAKAISHEGFYSATEARYKMTVTLDANAFLVDEYQYDAPTVTGMAVFALGRTDTSRYFVTEDGAVMSTKFPAATMSSYGNVMSSYNSVAAAWTSETESFGISLTGAWRAKVPITDIQGTHTETLELSDDDGVSWAQYSFTAKATARAARVKVNAASGSSILVTIPEATIRVDATPREESGTVTSLATGGALVQLANEYTAAMTLGVTPIGSAPRTAVFDQLILAPVDGLVFEAMGVISTGEGAAYCAFPGSRVVQAGDHVEYDVFVVSQPPTMVARSGGLGMYFNGDWNHYFYDSYGSNWDSESIPTGQWVSRKFDLTAKAGMTVSSYRVIGRANEQTVAAPAKVVYRNIRITNGAGTTRATIWTTGGALPTLFMYQNFTNGQCGYSNTFRVYVFDQNNTQVANSVMWNFKGV